MKLLLLLAAIISANPRPMFKFMFYILEDLKQIPMEF